LKIAIIGRSEILYNTALKILDAGHKIQIIITSKESPEYKVTVQEFKALAEKTDAEFLNTSQINNDSVYQRLTSLTPMDLAVSMNYSSIIEQKVINLFRIGILNAHGGDLPRYRGNACQSWAIINGEDKIGLCIHKMKGDELDSGDIIFKKYYPVTINTRIGEVWNWMNAVIPNMFVESLNLLENDPAYILESQSKNRKDFLRCYPRNPDDGKIDFIKSSVEILRLINASSEPYTGAFCTYENNKLFIWRAELLDDNENYLAVPGQVSRIDQSDGSVTVITGNGKLKLTEVGVESKRTNPAEIIKTIRKRLQ
jgi:methionyl-tRNA formyltransferase